MPDAGAWVRLGFFKGHRQSGPLPPLTLPIARTPTVTAITDPARP
jgi:hypothetical protein